jgi:drug/metabolite transporter (DMT)-like permease
LWIAAAFVTMISFGTNNSIFKWSTKKGLSKVHLQFIFYFVAFIITLMFGLWKGLNGINAFSILLGVVIGILNAIGNIQMAKAFEKGPASLTSPLIGANVILPIICAALIFHEKITWLHWIGIAIMLGAAMVIQYSPSSSPNSQYKPWLIRVLFAILSFGILGILMKTSSYLHFDSLSILISMYGGGCIYLGVNSLIDREKWINTEINVGFLAGLISIIGYSAYFYALKSGMASIVFPIVGLNCLIVVFAGYWLFKEKLKRYQIVGVCFAMLGIIFTKI